MVNRRRLLLLATLLLLMGSIAGALAPREDARDEPARTTPTPARPASASSVTATLPGSEPVMARVGDLVRLRVRHPTADQVELPAFGLSEAVGEGLIAELTFVPDRPGRFPVRLSLAGKDVGSIVVRER